MCQCCFADGCCCNECCDSLLKDCGSEREGYSCHYCVCECFAIRLCVGVHCVFFPNKEFPEDGCCYQVCWWIGWVLGLPFILILSILGFLFGLITDILLLIWWIITIGWCTARCDCFIEPTLVSRSTFCSDLEEAYDHQQNAQDGLQFIADCVTCCSNIGSACGAWCNLCGQCCGLVCAICEWTLSETFFGSPTKKIDDEALSGRSSSCFFVFHLCCLQFRSM